ncbi:MAG: hypothetical protein AB1696_06955 [Planctomycetota bacterium]
MTARREGTEFAPEEEQFRDVQPSFRHSPRCGYSRLTANRRYHPVDVTCTIADTGAQGNAGRLSASDTG